MKKVILFICVLILAIIVSACTSNNSSLSSGKEISYDIEDLSKYFSGYDGCFVLYDQNDKSYTIYNEKKSLQEISPCSTFKIVNTLIGLETKVVKDETTIFKWDGNNYPVEAWNQDIDLASAIKYSCFWYYQQIALSVGEQKIQELINSINYGNKDISGGITQFWQQSSLKISPKEQVDLLRKIYRYDVPFSRSNVDILKKVIRLSEQNKAVLSGKTGSGLDSAKFVPVIGDKYVSGWFIGYVEKGNNVYFFATNIGAEQDATGSQAKEITLKILNDKQIY